MKKALSLLVSAVLLMGVFAGCGGNNTPAPQSPAQPAPSAQEPAPSAQEPAPSESEPAAGGNSIAVLVPSADHGWTGAVLKYAKEAAGSHSGYDITVYAATDAKNQQEQIDDLLASATPPDGIVILPYDNTMESSMVNVAAAGIPFIMYDRIIDNPVVQDAVTANVKGDNEGIGAATAKRFMEKGLEPGDKLYVMIGDTSSVPEMRNKGFKEELAASGWSDEQIAAIEFSAATNWSRSTGKQLFIDWINSKTVADLADYKYIFTHDDEIGMGILEALSGTEIEESKKQAFYDSIVSLGASSGLDEMYQVLRGQHSNSTYPDIVANFDLFSVTYDPGMVKTAIQDMVDHLEGKAVNKDHTIAVEVVDSTNVDGYQGF